MNKVLDVDQAVEFSKKIKLENKTIVLVGGVFDILHSGHISFLEQARKQADLLFLMLETDEKVKQTKGKNRPLHFQKDRASILATIPFVDIIILLPFFKKDDEYDQLVEKIKPDIIAVTAGDKGIAHKIRQAKIVGGRVVEVIKRLPISTTDLIEKI